MIISGLPSCAGLEKLCQEIWKRDRSVFVALGYYLDSGGEIGATRVNSRAGDYLSSICRLSLEVPAPWSQE